MKSQSEFQWHSKTVLEKNTKIRWKSVNNSLIVKTTLHKKRDNCRHCKPDFQQSAEATHKIRRCWHYGHGAEDMSYSFDHLIWEESAKSIYWREDWLFNKLIWEN